MSVTLKGLGMAAMTLAGAASQPMDAKGIAAEKVDPVATTRPEDSARESLTMCLAFDVAWSKADYKGLKLALESVPEGMAKRYMAHLLASAAKGDAIQSFFRVHPGNEQNKVVAKLVEQVQAVRGTTTQPEFSVTDMVTAILEYMPEFVAYEFDPAVAERNAREALALPLVAQESGAKVDEEIISYVEGYLSRRVYDVMVKERDRPAGGSDADKMSMEMAAASYKWILANRTYFYFHPISRQFGLDAAAREHHKSSAEYRASTPWPANEGPNDPNVEKPTK